MLKVCLHSSNIMTNTVGGRVKCTGVSSFYLGITDYFIWEYIDKFSCLIIIISTFSFDDYSPNLKKKQNWMHYYFSLERKIVFFTSCIRLSWVNYKIRIQKIDFFFFKNWINLQRIEKSCSCMNRCQCVHEPVLLRSLLKKTNWTPVGDKVSSNYDLIGWLYTFIYFAGLNIFYPCTK